MKRALLAALTVAAGLAWSMTAVAEAQLLDHRQSCHSSQQLVCKDASGKIISPCRLGYGAGRARGRIAYNACATGDVETMRLALHGLKPHAWYLVTMQDLTGHSQFSTKGASCLFGVKHLGPGFEFCDVALVQTDRKGNAYGRIPTDAGLTGDHAPAPTCFDSNVPGLNPDPNLGQGHYTGLTMVIKKVEHGLDGTAPNCAILSTGGTPELFERGPLPDFAAK